MAPLNHPKRGRSDEDDDTSTDDCEIKDMLRSLSKKMDSLSDAMSDVDNRLNVKIDGLESSLCKKIDAVKVDVDKRLVDMSADVDRRLNDAVLQSNRKCEDTATIVSTAVSQQLDEIRAIHELRLDKLERSSLDKELIITGVPMESNDDPWSVLGDICKAINCNLNERDFTAVFRLKSKNGNSNRSVPIVIKVYDNFAKQQLLSCYFKRMSLNLKDIGFQTSARIFINESLTKSNREIFNLAAEAKKSNKIVKLFTRNGLVHVQRSENDKPICIYHINELQQLLPQSTSNQISSQSSLTNRRGGQFKHKTNSLAPKQNAQRSSSSTGGPSSQVPVINGAVNPNPGHSPIVASAEITSMDHEATKIQQSQPISSMST